GGAGARSARNRGQTGAEQVAFLQQRAERLHASGLRDRAEEAREQRGNRRAARLSRLVRREAGLAGRGIDEAIVESAPDLLDDVHDNDPRACRLGSQYSVTGVPSTIGPWSLPPCGGQ